MRILLLFPPQARMISPAYMKKIQEGLGFLPPLGILYLAAYLLEHTRHEVEVLDAHVERMTVADVEAHIRRTRPDAVGISATTFSLVDALDCARAVKRVDPTLPVILGGPHTALFPRESVARPEIDYVVVGEGEVPLALLLDRLEERGHLPGRPWRTEDGTLAGSSVVEDLPAVLDKHTPRLRPRQRVLDLDGLPTPRRDLVPWQRYSTVVSRTPPTTTLISSRGCPYACTFCHTAGGKKFRPRSPRAVVREMQEALDLGIREFLFFDETFTLDRERAIAISEEIVRQGLDVSWDVRARVDCVDPDLLRLMRRAGCSRVQYGIEAGTQRIMDALQKGITLDQARDAIRWTREAGLATYADFLIGAPGETREEMLRTLAFARSLALDYVHFSILVILPHTPLHRRAVREGRILEDLWRGFARNPDPDFEVPFWTEILSREELEDMVMRCLRSSYLRADYVLRSLAQVRSMGELVRKARAGLKLIGMGP